MFDPYLGTVDGPAKLTYKLNIKATYCMIQFIQNVRRSQIHRNKKQITHCHELREGGETASDCLFAWGFFLG